MTYSKVIHKSLIGPDNVSIEDLQEWMGYNNSLTCMAGPLVRVCHMDPRLVVGKVHRKGLGVRAHMGPLVWNMTSWTKYHSLSVYMDDFF